MMSKRPTPPTSTFDQKLTSTFDQKLSEQMAQRKLERHLENKLFNEKKAKQQYQARLEELNLTPHTLRRFSEAEIETVIRLGSRDQRLRAEAFLYIRQTRQKHWLYPPGKNHEEHAQRARARYLDPAIAIGTLKPEPCRVCLMHNLQPLLPGIPYIPDPFHPFNFLWLCEGHLTAVKKLRLKPDPQSQTKLQL